MRWDDFGVPLESNFYLTVYKNDSQSFRFALLDNRLAALFLIQQDEGICRKPCILFQLVGLPPHLSIFASIAIILLTLLNAFKLLFRAWCFDFDK